MSRFTAFAFGVLLLSQTVVAQDLFDTFTYPAGTTIPGYTEQRGNWTSTGTSVQGQYGVTFQELVNNGVSDANCCVEVTAIYDTATPGLQYAGPIARYTGAGAAASYFMVKVQDNGSPYTGFDRYYVYYASAGGFPSVGIASQALPVPTTMARVRLQVKEVPTGVLVEMFIDTNMDGIWDHTGSAITTLGVGTQGGVGATVYQSSLVDDLRYFGSTLTSVGAPAIGTSIALQGAGHPNYVYVGAMSLGHGGIYVPGGDIVPLDADPVFFLSLDFPLVFQNFLGITAGDGTFAMTLNIPPDPSIIGLSLFAASVMWNGVQVDEVSPDVQVTIQ